MSEAATTITKCAALVSALVLPLIVCACNFSVTVSERNMISQGNPGGSGRNGRAARLAHDPSARWYDLQGIALDPAIDRGDNFDQVFSRRFLLRLAGHAESLRPDSKEPDDFAEQVARRDVLIQEHALEIYSELEDMKKHLYKRLAECTCIVEQTVFNGWDSNHDENGFPVAPNWAAMRVRWWRGDPGTSEPAFLIITLVQEGRQWRIDGITPSLLGFPVPAPQQGTQPESLGPAVSSS